MPHDVVSLIVDYLDSFHKGPMPPIELFQRICLKGTPPPGTRPILVDRNVTLEDAAIDDAKDRQRMALSGMQARGLELVCLVFTVFCAAYSQKL